MPRSFRLGADGFLYVDDGAGGEPEARLSKSGVCVVTAAEFASLMASPAIKAAMVADIGTTYMVPSGPRWFSDGTNMRSGSVSASVYDATYILTDGTDQRAQAQAAINAAITGGFRDLHLPAGDINVGLGLEIWGGVLATLAGSPQVFGLRVWGAGSQKTRLLVANNGVALWWHTADNLANPAANTQPSQMREFGGGGFSIVGTGINSGAVGIRVGGKRPNQPDVMENQFFTDVLIDRVTSCFQNDDSTNTVLRQFSIGKFKYGFEHGYNSDNFRWDSGYFGHEDPTLLELAATGINGPGISTFTFVDIAGSDAVPVSQKIEPGWVINAPGVFPHGTYVKTISTNSGSCTITTQDYTGATVNSTAALGSGKISFFCGRVHVYGTDVYTPIGAGPYPKDASPWASPYWGIGKATTTQGRENGNHLTHGTVCGGRVERFLDAGGGSHHTLTVNVYSERVSQGAKLGRTGGGAIPQNVIFEKCYPNVPQHLTAPWVQALGDNLGGKLTIRDCSLDAGGTTGVSGLHPWVSIPTYGGWTLVWENNALAVSTAGSAPQIVAYTSNIGIPSDQLIQGDAVYSNSARKGCARQNFSGVAAVNWGFTCQDIVRLDVNQAVTVNNPDYYPAGVTYKDVVFVIKQDATGGRVVTFGSMFVNQSGAALGAISAGTANQVAALPFKFVNNKFVLQAPVAWA